MYTAATHAGRVHDVTQISEHKMAAVSRVSNVDFLFNELDNKSTEETNQPKLL